MQIRPDVFAYRCPNRFVHDMLLWRKARSALFSVRREVAGVRGLSPTQVTLLAQGKRRITPERVPALARLLGLTHAERARLSRLSTCAVDDALGPDDVGEPTAEALDSFTPTFGVRSRAKGLPRRKVHGGFLARWFELHVWEAARLPAFRPDGEALARLLRGLAPARALQRVVELLLHQGLLRRTPSGRVVPDAAALETTDGIPDASIRRFHVNSLRLAARATEALPPSERECQTLLVTLSPAEFEELRERLKEAAEAVVRFGEDRAAGKGDGHGAVVYQVILNAIPVTLQPGAGDRT